MEGKVELNDVACIVTSTKAATDAEWLDLMEIYCRTYWRKDTAKGVGIASLLRDRGKIVQPRVEGRSPPDLNASPDVWVKL